MNNKPVVIQLNSNPDKIVKQTNTSVKKPVTGLDKVNLPIESRGHKGFNHKRK